jgi:hypothetical protein
MDTKQVRRNAGLVWGYKMGQMVSILIHLGDKLSLFKSLQEVGEPISASDFAKKTGLHPRWLKEWLRGMTAAKILTYTDTGSEDTEKFALTPEMGEVLANEEDSLTFAGGAFASMPAAPLSDALCNAFKTGIGLTYEETSRMSPNAHQTKRMLGVWTKQV